MSPLRVAAATLAAFVLAVVLTFGGLTALAYFLLFLLATLPGLPIGFLIFGRAHAASWISGMLLGYALTCLACWAIVFSGVASSAMFVIAWVGTTALVWGAAGWLRTSARPPLVTLPGWSDRATTALVLVLLLVPLLTAAPFARVGSEDGDGDDRYRAYFTADFVWHMALVAELKKHEPSPRNPFLASDAIHYYWAYFLVPTAGGPLTGADVALSLKVNAVGVALLFVSAIYVAGWAALPAHPFAVAGALVLTILASSIEGLAAIAYLFSRGESLAGLRNLNVDAISRGVGGLRVDNLPRAMWYTPQHAMSYSLGLIAIPIAIAGGVHARLGAILAAGVALGLCFMLNPLVGAIFCSVYALVVIADAFRNRSPVVRVFRHAAAVPFVLLAFGWTSLNQVAEGAGSALHFGPYGPAADSPLVSFGLSFGPLLILLGAGLLPHRALPLRTATAAITGVVLSILVMHLVILTIDLFWVGFRAGHLIFVFAPALVARGLLVLASRSRRLAWGAAALVAALGTPTTAIDAFNAQDVENDHMGPGFHWTVTLSPAQQEALAWIRNETPTDAIVQAEPTVRGRETWSLIPTWGERRMAAGLPISLMHEPAYDRTSAQVRAIYEGRDPAAAWKTARALNIDYLYVDNTERKAYPNTAKFDSNPQYFFPVFRNSEVTVYQISGN
jgi:hypothetical protein